MLATLLAACTRAGWTCKAYAQFVQRVPDGAVSDTVVLEAAKEEYAVDLDDSGTPLGVELLHIALSDPNH